MKRREVIAASGSIIVGSGFYSNAFRESIAVDFSVDSPSLNPSDISKILIDFNRINVVPQFVDDGQKMDVEVQVTLEDSKYGNTVSDQFDFTNGTEINLSNSTVGRVLIENINEDQLSISGEIVITFTVGDFNQDYRREFVISGENIPDGAVGIEDWYDFDNIRNDLSGDYVQLNDLNSQTPGYDEIASPSANSGLGFRPLSDINDQFTGSYDGGNHRIEDLYVEEENSNTSTGKVSIFGTIGSGSVVENLVVNNSEVVKNTDINDGGVIAASIQSGTVRDCYVNADLRYNGPSESGFHYGLIVGNCHGTVKRCSTEGSVNGHNQAGGVVGNTSTQASFIDCRTTATINSTSTRAHNFHGDDNIDDSSKLEFTRCFSAGTAEDSKFSNGQGTYSGCYHDSEASGHSSNVSGVSDLTTSEMQGSDAESNMSEFDYSNVWESISGQYPIIRTIPRDIQT